MKCADCRWYIDGGCHYYGWTDKSPCKGKNKGDTTGYDERSGLYISRYYAKKATSGGEVVVKVEGGYKIMTAAEYNIWRKQK